MTEQLSLFGETKQIKGKKIKPQQMDMFGQTELAQFGVVANPRMDLSSGKLGMIIEDTRTEEEKGRDTQKAAEELTGKLF